MRLPCGVQALTAALLFRADYARLPDCAAVESFTAELGRCVLAPQGKRVTLAYVLGLYAFLAVLLTGRTLDVRKSDACGCRAAAYSFIAYASPCCTGQ